MQTFLPYKDFRQSLQCLDNKRLGKQRVEAYQIYNTLMYGSRWKNHPAVKMWVGYEIALLEYMNIAIDEWIKRGFNNNMQIVNIENESYIIYPPWLGNEKFHSSHRSNLLRKDALWYGGLGWIEEDNLPYVWPV